MKETGGELACGMATAINPNGAVAVTERQAARQRTVHVFESSFQPMRTAFAQRDDRAYLKLIVDAQNDRVMGIHMLGPDAPKIVQSLVVAL